MRESKCVCQCGSGYFSNSFSCWNICQCCFFIFYNYFWHQYIKTIQKVQTVFNFSKKKIFNLMKHSYKRNAKCSLSRKLRKRKSLRGWNSITNNFNFYIYRFVFFLNQTFINIYFNHCIIGKLKKFIFFISNKKIMLLNYFNALISKKYFFNKKYIKNNYNYFIMHHFVFF
jgi:hypothetical protein